MDETIKDQALDSLIRILEFYHKALFKAEHEAITGIQEAKLRLLLQLSSAPMLSMTTLGRLLYTSKPHVTLLVDALVTEGLVERYPDPKDRRVINIRITPDGKEKLNFINSLIREHLSTAISNLHESDLITLHSSGEQFIQVVSRIP